MRIADSIASHLLFLLTLSIVLPVLIHAHDFEPLIPLESAVQECSAPSASYWPISLLLFAALAWAVSEYVQFVLLLITDEEAVTVCYQQRCSAANMLTHRGVKKESDTADESRLFQPPKPRERVPSDYISTNMIRTPSQLSDESDEKHKHYTDGDRGTPEMRSMCTCDEEDYLVAMEDDVRKPGACLVHKPVKHTEGTVKEEKEGDETTPLVAEEDHGQGSAVKSASEQMPTKTEHASESSAADDHDDTHDHNHGDDNERAKEGKME